jgi:hypothetical protein
MIFVQIVAYRDMELEATVRDCLAKADNSDGIHIGLVLQYLKTDVKPKLSGIDHINVLEYEPDPLTGVGFMRQAANSLYRGEKFYLQIDAHTRFDKHWDTMLISQLQSLYEESDHPVLSTYPPMYWYEGDVIEEFRLRRCTNTSSIIITATGWHSNQLLMLEPLVRPQSKMRRTFALAGGFVFSSGDFASIKQDESILFLGEEIVLAAQAYTRGWDIFSPEKCPIYHHYTRQQCSKPWTDFVHVRAEANRISEQRVVRLLADPHYGYFGSTRSFNEYESFCGISFNNYHIRINSINPAHALHPRPF